MKRLVPFVLALAVSTPASAGSGPWTLAEGSWTAYGGVDYRHFVKLAGQDGGFTGEGVTLPTGIRTLTVQGVVSYGVLDWAEIELNVPWVYSQADRPDVEACTSLGLDACESVQSLGLITTRAKVRLLDEIYGPPLTLSLGPAIRTGEFTHDERSRLTAPTEGQTDIGAFLTAGRSGGLGSAGYYAVYAQGAYYFRMPNAEVGGVNAPGDEWTVDFEATFAPVAFLAFGPDLYLSSREGLTLAEMNESYIDDPDRYAALGVFNVKYGGKVMVRSSRLFTVILGATQTLYAENNPTDTFSFSFGLNYQGVPKDEG